MPHHFQPLLTSQAPQAYLWDDDYLDVVADAEDGWGREAAAVPEQQGEATEAPAPVTSAYASDAFRHVGCVFIMRSALETTPDTGDGAQYRTVSIGELLLLLAGAQPPAVLDVRDSAGESSVLAAALRARGGVVVVHSPMAQLKEALAEGRLDEARRMPGGIVCVSHTPDLAAQARRVFYFGGLADCMLDSHDPRLASGASAAGARVQPAARRSAERHC